MQSNSRYKQKIVNDAIDFVEYVLEKEYPFITCEGFGDARIELTFPYKKDPSVKTLHTPNTEKDQDGYFKPVVLPSKPEPENLQFAMDMVQYTINHFVHNRTEVSGKLTFYFVNGHYDDYNQESILQFNDIRNKVNNPKLAYQD